ncbi:protein-L-isoaspartate(D-aspartate) O-methyltransferase [Rhodanobacter umsongensis]|uniref:Protein-L-isoaspartate O-methyltransferase n=1 Tax=Rhodanobacter umsongensis TaxID=633153 RepID=A0ABW0JP06_9GAMM
MSDYVQARSAMLQRQLVDRGIHDQAVLEAMRHVPRHAFVGEAMRALAYDDTALPIEAGQTISQPYIVALTLQAAEIQPNDSVLEIGTGSGYVAAVLARMARRVDSIERVPSLAESARQRLQQLGVSRVEVHTADGTLGWPPGAPFDVIVAAASGPQVPPAWRQQLAIGGRLVMPIGDRAGGQRLYKLTRLDDTRYEEEDLGAVMFVPLIGKQGWAEDGSQPARPAAPKTVPRRGSLAEAIRRAAEPLPDPASSQFGALFDRYADRRVVLLGEASHGTAEFYQARAAITRRLIERHGFTIVAVEADWPDAASIDRYVRQRPAPPPAEPPFQRFPTWMWRNTDVQAFTQWLRAHNDAQPVQRRAGFYGLDMYSLSSSVAAVLGYLDRVDPTAAEVARERYACLTPWQKDPAVYGRTAQTQRHGACEEDVVAQLRDLLRKRLDYAREDGVLFLDAAQNARLVTTAERYYRTLYQSSVQSWNLRDTHMFETLNHVLDAHGPASRAVVWAHNSHVGNAAATEMGQARNELNIGQLCREKFGRAAALIGFGTHHGTVAAAHDWDGPMEVMQVRPAREDSYEYPMHQAGEPRFLLDLRPGIHDALRERLAPPRLERFIGVIYRPQTELQSHYSSASLPDQFDAYAWFDDTRAVTPLAVKKRREGVPDTYPFGV